MDTVQDITRQSRLAARQLSSTSEATRNQALVKMAEALEFNKAHVLECNAEEVEQARRNGLPSALIKRLTIDH